MVGSLPKSLRRDGRAPPNDESRGKGANCELSMAVLDVA